MRRVPSRHQQGGKLRNSKRLKIRLRGEFIFCCSVTFYYRFSRLKIGILSRSFYVSVQVRLHWGLCSVIRVLLELWLQLPWGAGAGLRGRSLAAAELLVACLLEASGKGSDLYPLF